MRSKITSAITTAVASAATSSNGWFARCLWASGLLLAAMFSAPSIAGPLPEGVQLGMSAQELEQTVPSLSKVRRPTRMTGGLLGSWTSSAVSIGGVQMTPTFFFAEGELKRIEYFTEAPDTTHAFEALVAWGKGNWGDQVTSYGPRTVYASWAKDEIDAMVQQTEGSPGQLRLIVKQRVLKDASQL